MTGTPESAASALPLVTVVVAVYNGEPFIEEALSSALAQEYPRFEVVVVDDGSTDATPEILRRQSGVRSVRQSNQGMSAARNRGVQAARGDLVTFLDADDVLLPHRLRVQVEFLAARRDVGCVLARHELLLAPGEERPGWLVPDAIFGDPGGVEPGSAMLTTSTARRIGFDPAYPMVDGIEWLGRLTDAGVKVDVCDQVLWKRRIHDKNHSRDRQAVREEMLRLVRQRIASSQRQPGPAEVPRRTSRQQPRPEQPG